MRFDPASTAPTTARTLHRYFEVSLYLLIVAGFATIAGTGKLDFASLLLVGGAVVLRGFLVAKGRGAVLSESATSLLTLIYVGFYALDVFLLSRFFVSATVHVVRFATVVKIVSVPLKLE